MAWDPARIAEGKRDFEIRESVSVPPGGRAVRKYSSESKSTPRYTHSFGHSPCLIIDAEGREHPAGMAEGDEICPGVRQKHDAFNSDYGGNQYYDGTTTLSVDHEACPIRALVCFSSRYSASSKVDRKEEYYYVVFERAEDASG